MDFNAKERFYTVIVIIIITLAVQIAYMVYSINFERDLRTLIGVQERIENDCAEAAEDFLHEINQLWNRTLVWIIIVFKNITHISVFFLTWYFEFAQKVISWVEESNYNNKFYRYNSDFVDWTAWSERVAKACFLASALIFVISVYNDVRTLMHYHEIARITNDLVDLLDRMLREFPFGLE